MSAATLATTTADVLSLKLYHLTEIVKLAAFATENQREAAEGDTSGVLYYVAEQLQAVNSEFTETVHDLARARKNGGAA